MIKENKVKLNEQSVDAVIENLKHGRYHIVEFGVSNVGPTQTSYVEIQFQNGGLRIRLELDRIRKIEDNGNTNYFVEAAL